MPGVSESNLKPVAYAQYNNTDLAASRALTDTGTNEVQTLTLTGGLATQTFKLTYNGHESSAAVTIPTGGYANVTAAQIKACLILISDWTTKADDIYVVKSTNDYIITFSGSLGYQDITAITLTSATGAAAGTVAETTKGVSIPAGSGSPISTNGGPVQGGTPQPAAKAAILQSFGTQNVRWTDDGTVPTATKGMLLISGSEGLFYTGKLSKLKFIRTASDATLTLNVAYYG